MLERFTHLNHIVEVELSVKQDGEHMYKVTVDSLSVWDNKENEITSSDLIKDCLIEFKRREKMIVRSAIQMFKAQNTSVVLQ